MLCNNFFAAMSASIWIFASVLADLAAINWEPYYKYNLANLDKVWGIVFGTCTRKCSPRANARITASVPENWMMLPFIHLIPLQTSMLSGMCHQVHFVSVGSSSLVYLVAFSVRRRIRLYPNENWNWEKFGESSEFIKNYNKITLDY